MVAEAPQVLALIVGTGALVAVAAVILVLTLSGPGKPRDGTDDSGSSSHFAPAATAVAGDFSREISLGGGALTMITSQANGTDGRFFDIQDGERVSAVAAPAEPKPGQPDSYLATTQRQIISQSALSVEVAQVASAVDQVRAIAESFGGFVEQLSSSGVAQDQHPTLTIRIPQTEFFNAFDRIKLLGEMVSENAGSEDMTDRFIDLEAQLKSA